MTDAAREPLKNIYNQASLNHKDDQTYLQQTPGQLPGTEADTYLVKTHAPDVWDAAQDYGETREAIEAAQEELGERVTAATVELPDELRKGDRARLEYDQQDEYAEDRSLPRSLSPTTFFIQASPALNDEDADLAEYLESNFTRHDHPAGEDLVESWDERYPGWEEEVEEAAEKYAVTEAIDELYELNDQLRDDANELRSEIEDQLSPDEGLVDRLLGR